MLQHLTPPTTPHLKELQSNGLLVTVSILFGDNSSLTVKEMFNPWYWEMSGRRYVFQKLDMAVNMIFFLLSLNDKTLKNYFYIWCRMPEESNKFSGITRPYWYMLFEKHKSLKGRQQTICFIWQKAYYFYWNPGFRM